MNVRVDHDRKIACPRCGYDLRGAITTWTEQCPLQGTCTECGLQFIWAEVLHPEKFSPLWCVEFVRQRRKLGRACCTTFIRSFRPWRFWSTLKMSLPIRWRRIALYILSLLLPLLLCYVGIQSIAAVRVRIVVLQQAPQSQANTQLPVTISHSYLSAAIEAVCFPWRTKSSGTITHGLGVTPYPAPSQLHSMFRNNLMGRSTVGEFGDVKTLAGLGLSLWVWLLFPLTFILLPASRRKAKVRWAHLFRITAYAAFIPSTAITAILIPVSLGYAFDSLQGTAFGWGHLISRYAMIPMLIIWWAGAIKRYLCIPHGWAVAVLLTSMLSLVFLGVLWAFFPDLALEVLWPG